MGGFGGWRENKTLEVHKFQTKENQN